MRSCGVKQVLGCRCALVRKEAMAAAGLLGAPPRQSQQLPASLQNRVGPDITGWGPCLARRRVGSSNVLARHSDARRVDAAPRGSYIWQAYLPNIADCCLLPRGCSASRELGPSESVHPCCGSRHAGLWRALGVQSHPFLLALRGRSDPLSNPAVASRRLSCGDQQPARPPSQASYPADAPAGSHRLLTSAVVAHIPLRPPRAVFSGPAGGSGPKWPSRVAGAAEPEPCRKGVGGGRAGYSAAILQLIIFIN
jgi:hypothetical protein